MPTISIFSRQLFLSTRFQFYSFLLFFVSYLISGTQFNFGSFEPRVVDMCIVLICIRVAGGQVNRNIVGLFGQRIWNFTLRTVNFSHPFWANNEIRDVALHIIHTIQYVCMLGEGGCSTIKKNGQMLMFALTLTSRANGGCSFDFSSNRIKYYVTLN